MLALTCFALDGFPGVRAGDDVARLCADCLRSNGFAPAAGDVLVVAHKVVSKAEGSVVDLGGVVPGEQARSLAARTGKDPRLCQVVLDESRSVLRARRELAISEQRLGWICANAGVDASNSPGRDQVVLLPRDPDASARRIRQAVRAAFGVEVGVIVDDTQGRAHREGTVGVCVGLAGLAALRSWVGHRDRRGYTLRASVEAVADELAAAATLLQGQADEGRPLVVVRGAPGLPAAGEGEQAWRSADLQLPLARDLFR